MTLPQITLIFGVLLLGAAGLWLLATLLFPKPSGLLERVALQISDLNPDAAELSHRLQYSRTTAFLNTVIRALGLNRFNTVGIATLQARLGRNPNPTAFFYQQLIWVLSALGIALLLLFLSETLQQQSVLVQALLLLSFAISGWMVPLVLLNSALKRRQRLMRQELPTVLEFLMLSLSAGEGIADSLRRVSRVGDGVIAHELRKVTALHSSGVPLRNALDESARMSGVIDYERFIRQLIAAMDRGNPLVNILRAQSEDSTELARKELMEAAGRKEIAMMVPPGLYFPMQSSVLREVWGR